MDDSNPDAAGAASSTSPQELSAPVPEFANAAGATKAAPQLNPRSCVTCRRRKVRCNKHDPCSNCVKAGIDCVFPGPGRAPRKARKPPDVELLARLRRLEGVVHNLGANVDENGFISTNLTGSADVRARFGDPQPGDSPTSDRSDSKRHSIDKQLGRLVISEDRSRYVSNSFWTAMSDEIAEMRDLLETSGSEDDDETASPGADHLNHQAFVFGYSSTMAELRSLHPTPSQTFILWEIYKENVDPLVRILHRPTARIILMNAASNLDRVSKPAEALLFAIYFGAVVSLTPEQCQQLLDEPKDTLVKKYRFATEQALARADFLNSNSLMCLQAFCSFLIFVRHCDDTRLVWSLGGLVIHLAQALGIHRDGTNFDLNPFDTEMRRRLWWHISLLDSRSAEDHGTDPSFTEQFYDTKIPLNINDEDIYPGMKEAPTERQGATEMMFCLIRFELSKFARRFFFTAPGEIAEGGRQWSVADKERMIDDCHRQLEEKYLRHCDMNLPIYWVSATVARLILAKMWLFLHHPRSFSSNPDSPLPPETRDRLFITSVEVIEFSHLLENNEKTAKWGWLFKTYMQWQAVAFTLSELCVRPPGPDSDRAWLAIQSVYSEGTVKTHKVQKGMLWKPLRQLMAKAKARRAQHEALAKSKDTLFTDLDSNTPMERFMRDYPDNAITLVMEAFGMDMDEPISGNPDNDENQPSVTRTAPTSVAANPKGAINPSLFNNPNIPASQNASPGALTGDSSSLPASDLLTFGWAPSVAGVDDFPVYSEPFQRYFLNAQEEWF